jgi:hypothetical protein
MHINFSVIPILPQPCLYRRTHWSSDYFLFPQITQFQTVALACLQPSEEGATLDGSRACAQPQLARGLGAALEWASRHTSGSGGAPAVPAHLFCSAPVAQDDGKGLREMKRPQPISIRRLPARLSRVVISSS